MYNNNACVIYMNSYQVMLEESWICDWKVSLIAGMLSPSVVPFTSLRGVCVLAAETQNKHTED